MSTTQNEPTIIDRYQAFRTRRFLKHERTYAHALPGWRTQRRRRLLVVGLGVVLALMVCVSVLCAFGFRQAALLWVPASLAFFPLWIVLQIVLGRQGDAPLGTLDEFELQQRNSARSIGLTVMQNLLLLPIFYLIAVSTFLRDVDAKTALDMTYAGALMALAVLMIGSSLPAMILGWTRRSDVDTGAD